MKFQTEVPLYSAKGKYIDFDAQTVLLGSCFSTHISGQLNHFKFQTKTNPFGILFNPKAILTFLTCVHECKIDERAVFFSDEQWKSFDAHSQLNHSSKSVFIDQLSTQLEQCNAYFQTASHFVITLGTAWSYFHLKTQKHVANCHKQSASEFEKKIFDVDETTAILTEIRDLIHAFNPKADIIFTISPVRHLKDGFVENTRSKAHLITAVHRVVEHSALLHYFPSYELLMDQLRDYRFYASDMIHPNAQAIDFIWQKFKSVWVDPQLDVALKTISRIQNGLQHKPFNPQSKAHQEFLKTLDLEIKLLKEQFPQLKL